MTTLHEVAKSNNCEIESSEKLMKNEGATNKLQFDICICRYFLCIEEWYAEVIVHLINQYIKNMPQ